MVEKKRVTTAPLTIDDIAESFEEIPEEEFLQRFDEILAGDLSLPERLEELLSLDDYRDHELRELFLSIVGPYLRPIQFAVDRIASGEQSRRDAVEALEALVPILVASETLEYEDVGETLKQLEQPLRGLAEGRRRRLAKRDVTGLTEGWATLQALIDPNAHPERAAPPSSLTLASLPQHVPGLTASHVLGLRGAGVRSFRDLAEAEVTDLVEATGLPYEMADRMRAFASGIEAAATMRKRRARAKVPAGWMRVQVESDVFKGRMTFEYGALGEYLVPVLETLAATGKRRTTKAPARQTKKKGATRATRTTRDGKR